MLPAMSEHISDQAAHQLEGPVLQDSFVQRLDPIALKPNSNHAMHALQEAEGDAALANPGSAYGASALGPSAGGGAGAAPGNANAQAGTGAESALSQPVLNGHAAADGASEHGSEQQGLSLPFDPVALVFKDIHYFVKRPDNTGEELELLKVPVSLLLLLLLAAVLSCSLLTTCLLMPASEVIAVASLKCPSQARQK